MCAAVAFKPTEESIRHPDHWSLFFAQRRQWAKEAGYDPDVIKKYIKFCMSSRLKCSRTCIQGSQNLTDRFRTLFVDRLHFRADCRADQEGADHLRDHGRDEGRVLQDHRKSACATPGKRRRVTRNPRNRRIVPTRRDCEVMSSPNLVASYGGEALYGVVDAHQGMKLPPFTSMMVPVMNEDPSPARNRTTEAISPGSP